MVTKGESWRGGINCEFGIDKYTLGCVLSRSVMYTSLQPMAPLSMGFFGQDYWGGLSLPTSEDLPGPGIEPVSLESPASAGRFFTTSSTWEGHSQHTGPDK